MPVTAARLGRLGLRDWDGWHVNARAYTWSGGRGDLTDRKTSWLRAACRERKIKPKGLTRRQMIDALFKHGR